MDFEIADDNGNGAGSGIEGAVKVAKVCGAAMTMRE